MLRNDNRGAVGALSTSQFISIFIVAAALLLLYRNKKMGTPVEQNAEHEEGQE